ncbi:MAG: SAM-dependent methyltransferase [Candidatus Magasanikbacteria bacterium RIFCSPLOWO2_01_FULL_43_20b]|uniref:SAM-dependent methyltransferase n=1 Tax=Candidatus Magasanikbacteria bacterium RIFCSPLOWO2_12_FULL_43_12 TaxID=1798692 RepID=A0A1F6MRE3_9BACT|nr:MAG: SAM-dependent methyltransferase [Candidatus Magasanikbacteria bacterium RIFCSPLOWO2_02_FULL_43_22]OGH72051.1 MAG: SAM-dependent methyltransferase [Candidatus Magasanikbacteria bacterium RIFCSPHIGHO2_02_FULL_44_13]OGH73012.1 MAG: SAM-dependent methyltransferase [Candidatus Magasanikbacteria bacterium RIFCSPLOWO2_01_FULL_43_20b]OGH74236.1 MAG: SAM-dependent methyltransferase [Candidatus Magasanikbacteria bacterium RIFCSPLOWO2_12_FULL_43_12]
MLITKKSKDYELIDSGEGEKLERFGKIVVARPDPQALWSKLRLAEWKKADAVFFREEKSGWKINKNVPDNWFIELGGLKFKIHLSAFKHVGLFPEQAGNWEWIGESIRSLKSVKSVKIERPVNILNLFGYTGGATLAAAKAGDEVCHVDGSKVAINWAKDNAEASGLVDKPIRWILDDAIKFVKREIKRGRRYDGIVMDPPAFGHGPGGEMWKIEDNFLELLDLCFQVLSEQPLFFLINGYASGYSALAYKNNLLELKNKFGGEIEAGELAIEEGGGRLLPCGIYARWCL